MPMWPCDLRSAATAAIPSDVEPLMNGPDSLPRDCEKAASPSAGVPDLGKLTRAARSGEVEAFSQLYDLYSFRVYKFLLVLTRGDEHQARDLCQAVFIKLARRWEVFDDGRRLWGWLTTLARNCFIDDCRARQRLSRFVPLEEWSAEQKETMDSEHQLDEFLRDALAALPPDERELLQAAYVDQRPIRELAEQAGQTYKAVESRLGRLRQKLKIQLLKALRHENELRS